MLNSREIVKYVVRWAETRLGFSADKGSNIVHIRFGF